MMYAPSLNYNHGRTNYLFPLEYHTLNSMYEELCQWAKPTNQGKTVHFQLGLW